MLEFFREYAVGFFTLAGGIIGFCGNYLIMKFQAKSEKEKTIMEFEENRRIWKRDHDINLIQNILNQMNIIYHMDTKDLKPGLLEKIESDYVAEFEINFSRKTMLYFTTKMCDLLELFSEFANLKISEDKYRVKISSIHSSFTKYFITYLKDKYPELKNT